MSNTIKVNLLFESNANQVKSNIQQLGSMLHSLSHIPIGVDSGALNQAAVAARELSVHLGKAVNVDTGRLDLSKLNASLKASGQNLTHLSTSLINAGTQGQQAFIKLANSIAQAQAPAITLGTTLNSMLKTMGQATMWSIAYGALNSLTQSFTGAIKYAKDLNKALTEISIVSEMAGGQLEGFAKQASRAAKELKTTTTAYAEAALIFYQQGLSGAEVVERTNAVIKMAHATGQSAQIVSDQLTAIWNNFDNGSKSLEYYADVITALGAATASSTDEIAQGLEKFAAIAETVGLSYEYAATALATVTSQTRQSADVVGTAFKTIFARMQDLDLGKRLDDGVTLGTYSQALEKIGVDVLNATGNMREMDAILNDMGKKWQMLTEAQKAATAQSVAGVRQYSQLIALMDNWDTFKINLEVAEDAEGTLQQQQNVWAKSVEAANERIKQSQNELYEQLLNDKTVIAFTNGIADVISVIADVIDSIGGLGPVLLMIAMIFSNHLIPLVMQFGVTLAYNFSVLTGKAAKDASAMRASFQNEMQAMIDSNEGLNSSMVKQLQLSSDLIDKKRNAESITKLLVGAQREEYTQRLQIYEAMNQEASKLIEIIALRKQEAEAAKKDMTFGSVEYAASVRDFTREGNTSRYIDGLTEGMAGNERRIVSNYAQELMDKNKVRGKTLDQKTSGIVRSAIDADSYADAPGEDTNLALGIRRDVYDRMGGKVLAQDKGGQAFMGASIESLEKVVEEYGKYNAIMRESDSILTDLGNAMKQLSEDNVSETDRIVNSHTNIKNAVEQSEAAHKELLQAQLALSNLDDNATAEERKAAEERVAEATKKHVQAERDLEVQLRKLSPEQQKLVSSTKKSQKAVEEAANAYQILAKKAGLPQKEIDKFINELKGMGDPAAKIDALTKKFTSLSNVSNLTAGEMSELAGILQDSLGEAGLNPQKLEVFINKLKESGKYTEDLERLLRGLAKSGASLDTLNTKGATATATLSGIARAASSLQMIFSSFQMIGNIFTDEDMSMMERITSGLMAISILLPVIGGAIGLISTATAVSTAMKKADTNATREQIAAELVKNGVLNASTAAIWMNTIATLSNPWLLAAAAILAVIAVVTAAVIGATSAISKNEASARDAQIKNNQATLELIDSIEQLSTSVDDLVQSYKDLQAVGKSTYDTLEELKEQIPDMIEEYRKLEVQLGRTLGVDAMEQGYQNFLSTGNITQFEQAKEQTDAQVAQIKMSAAQDNAANYREKMLKGATKGDGAKKSGKYVVTVGGKGTQGSHVYNGVSYKDEELAAKALLKDVLGSYWDDSNSQITFDWSDTAQVVDAYNKMLLARRTFESTYTAGQLSHMDTYRELCRELDEMAKDENAQGMIDAQNIVNETAIEAFTGGEDKAFIQQYGLSSNNYAAQRGQIIKDLAAKYNVTEDVAETMLGQSEETKNYERGYKMFQDDGQIAKDLEIRGTYSKDQAKQYYDKLSEYQKELFAMVDFTKVGSEQDIVNQMKEIEANREHQEIKNEVDDLEVDQEVFENYADLLAESNQYLDENETVTRKVALSNLKLNKGLQELADSWEDIDRVLKNGKKGTLEYAEAIQAVRDALETAYGYAPSTDFVEQNYHLLKHAIDGNLDALYEFQNQLAKDYVFTLDWHTSVNGGASFTRGDIQNTLLKVLDGIDQSGDMGQEVDLSSNQQNLDRLQAMLDNGQITSKQLEEMFTAKGYTIEYDGWKEMPGTRKVVTYIDVDSNGKETNRRQEIQEETIMVPIINGQVPKDTARPPEGNGKIKVRKNADESVLEDLKKDNEEKKKLLKDELERYHVINRTLQRLNQEYDALAEAKDRAFGGRYISLLEQEANKLQQLADATGEKLAEAEAYLTEDKNAIARYGIVFDQYGEISNYDDVYERMLNQYSSDQDKYGEAYETFKNDMAQYEETLTLVRDLRNESTDYANRIIDNKLAIIQGKIDIQLQISDSDQKIIDFMMDNLEDSAADVAKKFELLGKTMSNTMSNAESSAKGIEELLKLSGLSLQEVMNMTSEELYAALDATNMTKEQMEMIEEGVDNLISYSAELKETYESISDILIAAFEKSNEELDKSIEKLEYMKSIADSFYNIIDLAGKDALGIDRDLLTEIRETQFAIGYDQLSVQKSQLEQNTAMLKDAEAKLNAAINNPKATEAEIKELQETYDEIAARVREDQQTYLDTLATGLEDAAALFQQKMDNTIGAFEDAMTGIYGTFEGLQSAFDQQKEIDDRYLDDYQKIYELSKLNRDIVNSIDESDSIRAKTRLRELQEEITELQRSGAEATQFEVDALRAKYELRLAEIALEEAQNAKSKVTMRRDSEGNWGYVYTADQDAVSGAMQNYEDKLYAYQTKLQEYTDEMQARLIAIPQEYAEAVRAIYEDQTLSDEERYLRIMELQDYYQGMYDYVVSQLGESLDQSKILYEEDWNNYSKLTGYKISLNQEWVSSFDETIASQVTGLSTLHEAQMRFSESTSMMLQSLQSAYSDYRKNVQATLELALGDVETFFGDTEQSGTLAYYLEMMRKGSQDAADAAEDMGEKNVNAFKTTTTTAAEFLEKYRGVAEEWTTKTEDIGIAVHNLVTEYAKLNEKLKTYLSLAGQTRDLGLDPGETVAGGTATIKTYKSSLDTTDWTGTKGSMTTLSKDNIISVKKDSNSPAWKITTADNKEYWVNSSGLHSLDEQLGTNYVEQNSTSTGMSIEEMNERIEYGKIIAEAERKSAEEQKRQAWINSKPQPPSHFALNSAMSTSDQGVGLMYLENGELKPYWRHMTNKAVKNNTFRIVNSMRYGSEVYYQLRTTSGADIDMVDMFAGRASTPTVWIGKTMLAGTGAVSKELIGQWQDYLTQYRQWEQEGKILGFDTGGYTGSWDSSGRLAMLHQKELVLNAADTANFLSAVDILRDITSILDLQAIAQSNGLSSLASVPRVDTTQAQLQQEVTIHAEFPNAVNHSEIEQAFSTLLNNASQFANRKNK